ncbi:myo-inosose-2 dehydratase [Rhodovibrio sodomensis]|uniref:Myo-inosose-2 dehydratase n=1 Tax=Rhodovibrio sodomensis TaxID=1088 RepID=A0ABS1DL76_9PROT|nr:myo-inosose-2 dehydratase [Rhodovibrio sodomensis]MBK1670761.1 myo-inosose-2 dehydratase [Rhodovibrio sodomensis]
MTVRLGANPIGWSNDDERSLGAEIPLETCLAQAAAAGFEGVELGHKFPRTPEALRAALEPHRLELISGWTGIELTRRDVETELALIQPHLDLLKALGATVAVTCEVAGAVHGDRRRPLSARPVLAESEWPRFAERLSALAGRMRDQGLTLAYHHHVGTVVETEAETERLLAETDPAVGLLLDTGHLTHAGGDPVVLAERHAGRVVHLHAKDIRPDPLVRARAADASFIDGVVNGVFTVPGDGAIDFAGVLRPLAAHGYSGWLVMEAEQDPAKADPETYAATGYRGLRAAASAAGFLA